MSLIVLVSVEGKDRSGAQLVWNSLKSCFRGSPSGSDLIKSSPMKSRASRPMVDVRNLQYDLSSILPLTNLHTQRSTTQHSLSLSACLSSALSRYGLTYCAVCVLTTFSLFLSFLSRWSSSASTLAGKLKDDDDPLEAEGELENENAGEGFLAAGVGAGAGVVLALVGTEAFKGGTVVDGLAGAWELPPQPKNPPVAAGLAVRWGYIKAFVLSSHHVSALYHQLDLRGS